MYPKRSHAEDDFGILPKQQGGGERARKESSLLCAHLVVSLLAVCIFITFYWNFNADTAVRVDYQGVHGGRNKSLIVAATSTAKSPSSQGLPTQLKGKRTPGGKEEDKVDGGSGPHLNDMIIDIVSIGSSFRPENMEAQAATFGTHAAVRRFWTFTEANDTEASCATDLTREQAEGLCKYCRKNNNTRFEENITPIGNDTAPYAWLRNRAQSFAKFSQLDKANKPPASPMGWLCAQKRPVDALIKLLSSYQDARTKEVEEAAIFPDYVIVMDDDTFINMEKVVPALAEWLQHDKQQVARPPAIAAAGCLIASRPGPNFFYPYGGWGAMLSREVLRNFLRPIDCTNVNATGDLSTIANNNNGDNGSQGLWMSLVCRRLKQNLIGEQHFFRSGMSAKDLMFAFTFEQPLVSYQNWIKPGGFCMHSEYVYTYDV